jgi:hypothetical protein
MSDKNRQKKDHERKDKKNKAMREAVNERKNASGKKDEDSNLTESNVILDRRR